MKARKSRPVFVKNYPISRIFQKPLRSKSDGIRFWASTISPNVPSQCILSPLGSVRAGRGGREGGEATTQSERRRGAEQRGAGRRRPRRSGGRAPPRGGRPRPCPPHLRRVRVSARARRRLQRCRRFGAHRLGGRRCVRRAALLVGMRGLRASRLAAIFSNGSSTCVATAAVCRASVATQTQIGVTRAWVIFGH